MITENLSTLKIHKLTQAQYERELAAGNIDENALYLTPNEEADLSNYATKSELPTKTSDLTNDSGFLTGYTETDPTVPAWAKASSKPTYTKNEIGLGNVDNTSDANKPVSTAQATAIADAKKAGTDAQSNLTTHINNKSNPHNVTASQVGADASGTAESLVAAHNEATDAHADIRAEIAKVDAKIVNEIAIMSQSRYSDMTQSDLANLYAQGVRMIAITDMGYTNLVPLSVDENGNVYNGTGYKDDARLSGGSGGVSGYAQTGSVVTGFIPYTPYQTIRIKGAEWLNVSANIGGHYYLSFYDSEKTYYESWYVSSSEYGSDGGNYAGDISIVYDSTSGVTTFAWVDPSKISGLTGLITDAKYFRINAYGKGADLIVTVNEEI